MRRSNWNNGFLVDTLVSVFVLFFWGKVSRCIVASKRETYAEFVESARPRVTGDYVTCLVGNCENVALEQLQELGGIRGRIPCY